MVRILNVLMLGFHLGKIEVVIRPEDISLVESTQGLFTATVDSMLLEVYITKFVVLMKKGMNGLFNLLKRPQ